MIEDAPKNLEEAIKCLMVELDDDSKIRISNCKDYCAMVCLTHRSLGMWIRNNFGLWSGNDELVADLLTHYEYEEFAVQGDDASGVILNKLWERLREKRDE